MDYYCRNSLKQYNRNLDIMLLFPLSRPSGPEVPLFPFGPWEWSGGQGGGRRRRRGRRLGSCWRSCGSTTGSTSASPKPTTPPTSDTPAFGPSQFWWMGIWRAGGGWQAGTAMQAKEQALVAFEETLRMFQEQMDILRK